NGAGRRQPLASDVEDLHFTYWFDDAGMQARWQGTERQAPYAASWRSAHEVEAARVSSGIDPWDHVIAVSVCVVLRGTERGIAMPVARKRDGCRPGAVDAVPADMLTRTFRRTFMLRART